MNKCLNCNNTPIIFSEWFKGTNAFRYTCNACGAKLVATTNTYLGFLFTIFMVGISLYLGSEYFGLSIDKKGMTALVVILPFVIIGSLIGYQFGGYKLKSPNQQTPRI